MRVVPNHINVCHVACRSNFYLFFQWNLADVRGGFHMGLRYGNGGNNILHVDGPVANSGGGGGGSNDGQKFIEDSFAANSRCGHFNVS